MRTLLNSIAISIATLTTITGCGGSSEPSTTTAAVSTAKYIDSAVAGVAYNCGSQYGYTDESGTFKFERGKECSLSVGDILLRKVDTSNLSDQAIILEDNTTTAQFLQSIDQDGNPDNGISVTREIHTALRTEGIHSVPKSDEELTEVINKLHEHSPEYQGRFVSKEEAEEHLKKTRDTVLQNDDEMHDNNKQEEEMDDTKDHTDNDDTMDDKNERETNHDNENDNDREND